MAPLTRAGARLSKRSSSRPSVLEKPDTRAKSSRRQTISATGRSNQKDEGSKGRASREEGKGSGDHHHPDQTSDVDYRAHPDAYRILTGEMNVFKTPPYSEELKVLWRFKDEAAARESAQSLWKKFEEFRMDVTRKFLQMGRTRSLRYALRPGGRKYDSTTGKQMARSGKVEDEGKLKGAQVFEEYLNKVLDDVVYQEQRKIWEETVEHAQLPEL